MFEILSEHLGNELVVVGIIELARDISSVRSKSFRELCYALESRIVSAVHILVIGVFLVASAYEYGLVQLLL